MNIERMIKDLVKAFAKIFFNKEMSEIDKVDFTQMGSKDIMPILLKRLVYEGDYNKAEDILFDKLSKNNSDEMYQIAVDFYNLLLKKSDEELTSGNFSRKEIYQGLEDIKNFVSEC